MYKGFKYCVERGINDKIKRVSFTIYDTSFEENIECASLWQAIMIVYSRRNNNPYGNLAVALKNIASNLSLDLMIEHISTDPSTKDIIDINKLNKYLILM